MKNLFTLLAILSFALLNAQTINTVAPNQAAQGDVLSISIEGVGTSFLTATGTNVWLQKGTEVINPTSFNATSETNINANLSLGSNQATGLYDVNVQNSIDGTVTLVQGFEVTIINGLNYISNDIELNIYPNPASDYIKINSILTNNNDVKITIVDLNGKIIKTVNKENVSAFDETINISGLPSGVYNLVVKVNNKIYYKKIIKY